MILRLTALAGKPSGPAGRAAAAGEAALRRRAARSFGLASTDEPLAGTPPDPRYATLASPGHPQSVDFRSWQASQNVDIQRVTRTAMIHELTQQQTRSIERVVPWFLATMPAPYFRQVPESFRLDHIKAISAIKDANTDMHMNLRTHLPDGRVVLTFIRPGTMPGLLLSMIKELPYNQRSEEYLPLSRVQIYSAEDDSMSLNLFVYGEEAQQLTGEDAAVAGERYTELLQIGRDTKKRFVLTDRFCLREPRSISQDRTSWSSPSS